MTNAIFKMQFQRNSDKVIQRRKTHKKEWKEKKIEGKKTPELNQNLKNKQPTYMYNVHVCTLHWMSNGLGDQNYTLKQILDSF